MDPLTALSLASNGVQFIDFGTKLVEVSREKYSKAGGSPKPVDEFALAVEGLQSLIVALKTSIASVAESSPQTYNDAKLLASVRQAESLGEELLALLTKLRRKGTSRWSSVASGWKHAAHRRELEEWARRLNMLRVKLELILAHQFHEQIIQSSERLQHLDSYSRAAVLALLHQQASTQSGHDISYATSAGQLLTRLEGPSTIAELSDTQGRSTPRTEGEIRQEVERSLLKLLSYEVMTNRMLDISAPSGFTFEWIFQNEPPEHQWSSFPDWLARGSGLYWINGNEASGKSTMMKYIYNHSLTNQCLKGWARATPLATAAFFFWRSGSRLEKSQEGLLRSLLFTVLSEQSHLLPSVLPQEWATLYAQVSGESDSTSPSLGAWSLSSLRAAFKRLIKQEQSPLKLFFLVDGLDEYEGGDISEIVELFVNDISSSVNAKALVSSRPVADFDHFEECPSLTLHNLNRDDIREYVHDHLEYSGAFLEAARDDPETAAAIIRNILDMSNGLFLWVVLVVRTVRKRLETGSNLDEIRQELESHLPTVLSELYHEIWSRIPQADQVEASRILQIVLAGRIARKKWAGMSDEEEPLTLIDLAFADGDPEETILLPIFPWSKSQIRERCNRVAKTFMTKWPGFIEIQARTDKQLAEGNPASRIRYYHRSVMEFLNREETGAVLRAAVTGKSFCPYVAHLKSAVQHLKILENPLPPEPLPLLWTFITLALVSANQIESTSPQSAAYPALLAQLDNTMKHHHVNLQRQPDGQWIEKSLKSSQGFLERSDRGRDSKRRAELHWSNFYPDPKYSHPMKWEDCFLSLVIQFGLTRQLKSKLGQGSRELKLKKGRPLLDYALDPFPIAQYELITPAVVKILLRHGADPNERFEKKKTCWENALRWQYENFAVQKGRCIGGSMEACELAEIRLQILQLLIDHGADVDVSVETSGGMLAARKVVTDSFKPWTTDESFHSLIQSFDCAATTQAKPLPKLRQRIF